MTRTVVRLRLAVLGLVLALGLLELVFQLAAYATWMSRDRSSTSAPANGTVVLCVGDSFTFGLGAATIEEEYPAQAQKHAAAAGVSDLHFVNRGWPGQTSRDVLRGLDGQLRRNLPALVYVLVGTNDYWSRPAEWTAAEAAERSPEDGGGDGFRWRWRTGLFLALVVDWLRTGSDPNAGESEPPPFVGVWHDAETEVRIDADGSMRVAGRPLVWSLAGRLLRLRAAEGEETTADWRMSGQKLVLHCWDWRVRLELEPGPMPDTSPLGRARRLLERGEAASAEMAFAGLLESREYGVAARAGLAAALVALDRASETAAQVTWLRERYAEDEDPDVGEALASALAAQGETAEALDLACTVIEQQPQTVLALAVVEAHGSGEEVRDRSAQALARALASTAPGEPWRLALLRVQARVLRASDRVAALRSLLRIVLESGLDGEALVPMQDGMLWFTGDEWLLAVDGMDVGMEERVRLESVRERIMADTTLPSARLARHLVQIIAVCRSAGAKPVLMGYPGGPFDREGLGSLQRRVAQEQGADFVDLRSVFTSLPDSREGYFASDGHCNAPGYEVMGRVVAAHAIRSRQ